MKINKRFICWVICILSGAFAQYIGVPSGWMIGALIAAAIINLSAPNYSFQPVANTFKLPMNFSQVIIALLAALPSAKTNLQSLLHALPLAVLLTIITAFFAYLIALFLVKRLKISFSTAYISLLPGGASGMAVLAEESNANTAFVVFTQYLRVLIISLFIPFIAFFFGQSQETDHSHIFHLGSLSAWSIVAIGLLLGYLFKALSKKLPSPFLIPVVIIASILAFSFPEEVPQLPLFAIIFAYLYIGMNAGSKITRAAVIQFIHYLHWIILSIFSMITICGLFAYFLYYFNIVNALDAFLATAPGAVYIVFGFAANGAENGGFIVVMQIIRIISVLVIAGALPLFLNSNKNENT